MMNETILLREALRRTLLNKYDNPAIGLHEFNRFIYTLYRDKSFEGVRIGKISAPEPDSRVLDITLSDLKTQGILSPVIEGVVYQISNKDQASAQQIACSTTPYSYLAYLTAMEWHGITDRIPHIVHLVQSSQAQAKKLLNEQLAQEFPGISDIYPLLPKKVSSVGKIDGKELLIHSKKNFVMKRELYSSGGIRVTNIGETFLDMLKKPEMCGGFMHVMEVFEEYAKEYLPLIVKTVEKDGNSIDKARAGYILEDVCHLKHRTIDTWKRSVQRGGSRKLVASQPYKEVYSEVWCISLNL
ncbi:type IV toxin-antitoxin system AbiEi family antitoxin domain-containing protein [Photorhabdus tasmaniensis]|nr:MULTISPECIES: hypothetical protein [Photorhabdus]